MTALLRPDDDVLLRHAAGLLDAGFSLVVETHLELSGASRALHAGFEALGGLLLEEAEPAPVDPAALNAALCAIEEDARPGRSVSAPRRPEMPEGFTLPRTLSRCDIGDWRWIAPGLRSCRVALPDAASRAFLLDIASGVRIPRHGHEGDEMTCVLRGSFIDGGTRYTPGCVAQAGAGVEHDIAVDSDIPCLCLIALAGRTLPRSWLGKAYQKFRDL